MTPLSLFSRRGPLALLYLSAAGLFFTMPFACGGWAWFTLWLGIDCAIVGVAYTTGDATILAGRRNSASHFFRLLLLPYQLACRCNSWSWVRRLPVAVEVCDDVWLGRVPSAKEQRSLGIGSIVNLAPEMPARLGGPAYRSIAMLDLIVPRFDQIDFAVAAIEAFQPIRPTLVCCALGYSRSALSVAAWLIAHGRMESAEEAISCLEALPRRVMLSPAHRGALARWAAVRRSA